MHNKHILISSLLLLLSVGCDADSVEDLDVADDIDRALRVKRPDARIPVGAQWGPCDLTGVDQPGWWGCDGEPGIGLACARPVSDIGLNICVPQTADPGVDADCGNITAPFGLGVSLIGNGSAYCGADCASDADCAGGMACSEASNICAWIEN